MVPRAVPRILIGSLSGGTGKSLLVLALVVALQKNGLSVSCCVTGETLHLALLYSHITRRYARVLDSRLLDFEQIHAALFQASLGADVVLIDGHGGWLEGVEPGELLGSDAELAQLTGTPVVLVQDCRDSLQSVVDSVRNVLGRGDAPAVAGIVSNWLVPGLPGGSALSHPKVVELNRAAAAGGFPPCLGGLPEIPLAASLPSVAATQEVNPTTLPRQLFIEAANAASTGIDLDALLNIAATARTLRTDGVMPELGSRLCRFAVTDDTCFSLTYPDNLDILRHAGANLVTFSPLADSALPRGIGGLYITGACLTHYGHDLSQNEYMRRAIKQFADDGGVIYSEGAGTAFLCRNFQLVRGGPMLPGAGVIPADAFPATLGRTLITAQTIDDSVLGPPGLALRGLALGDWSIGSLHAGSGRYLVNSLRLVAAGREPVPEGFSASAQSCSTFALLHFGSCPEVARSLVEAAQVAARVHGEQGPER